ncbi:uncharacterized protein ACLA_030530 [Aspergillus clavatus NRRL 1]|uniref:Uncharacterized protein n=1 Tax=Aspergillus clavatus (strain ATCC 1007 / CBS 513.65 / DSM 816 / NCTC 3887 / NRRL 1 / QM 1276 / 107) TaxID=344612 RepID=A1CRP9_ASPCL|nr:uncharacterized protein ACLA_030530 [Aspergillus clavatus NRRL 1]EAW08320.1 conserved hypothetical protein [Aspergillus clavatus NRRL 1]
MQRPQSQSHPRRPHQRTSQDSSKYNRCWDWIVVDGNCHYAKNRSTFRSYRRAPGRIGRSRVLGIGTVELEVQRAPRDPRSNKLVLEDVWHMPDARCNGLSAPTYKAANPPLSVETQGEHCQAKKEEDGEAQWFGDPYCGLSRVVLAGNPEGDSYLRDGQGHMLDVSATPEELSKLHSRVRQW